MLKCLGVSDGIHCDHYFYQVVAWKVKPLEVLRPGDVSLWFKKGPEHFYWIFPEIGPIMQPQYARMARIFTDRTHFTSKHKIFRIWQIFHVLALSEYPLKSTTTAKGALLLYEVFWNSDSSCWQEFYSILSKFEAQDGTLCNSLSSPPSVLGRFGIGSDCWR